MTRRISIKDIADKLNISITTVSFVINGKATEKHISQKVTDKILKLVDEVGYRPNSFAKGLRTGKSSTIGFLVDNIADPFFSTIAHFLEEKATLYGYKILFCSTGKEKNKFSELMNVFMQRQVDGYIIATAVGLEDEVRLLAASGVPLVLFDRYLHDIPADYILVDNFASTFRATEHLINNGYRRCAFIGAETKEQQMIDRIEGYRQAITDHGLDEFILKLNYVKPGSTVAAIQDFLSSSDNIDAVVFGANYITLEGLRALKGATERVRGDLALISFDDFELLELISPTITAIEQPSEAIAQQIMELLMTRLTQKNDKKIFSTLNIPCIFKQRASSLPKQMSDGDTNNTLAHSETNSLNP
ncbi:LacI family DNA-binding transcriptional regulator [Pedobacter miscanthi]|uniref:LacI family transcriptional regulator n=1 Tax=Pedobacter miscanthi TaxID=2259170 RepID=A0A366L1Y6_9SPHI|nr:LacI family DNA-binding transcriptional regulator [Pedobacter miscanthi]RBQ07895.1 LacI family transcriptional regulator [Pedobacter miscanthi]